MQEYSDVVVIVRVDAFVMLHSSEPLIVAMETAAFVTLYREALGRRRCNDRFMTWLDTLGGQIARL